MAIKSTDMLWGEKTRPTSCKALVFSSILIILIASGGCSVPFLSKSSKAAPKSDAGAAALLRQGSEYLEKKKYSKAILKFERIREEYPFSAEAAETELKIGEAYHRKKKYSEAESAYKGFLSLRPTNENVPMVVYRLGLVHFDQFTTIDRDQKKIEAARGYFETVIKNHPESPYVADARKKLTKCRRYLAERKYYIGSFYLKEKKYAAAKERFEGIVRLYLDTPVGTKALFHLGEAYRLENNSVKAALAYEALIEHYPKSLQAKQAQVRLSQLSKVRHDPLAQLLMRDGRPVFAANLGAGGRQAAFDEGAGGVQGTTAGPPDPSTLNLATKKDVVFEESSVNGGDEKKGFFSRMVSAINPFGSSSDDKNKGSQTSSNGAEAAKADGNGREKPTESKDGQGAPIGEIDASLKGKGINTEKYDVASQPPTADLPEIKEEPVPPPSRTKEVLGKIDAGLKREGVNVTATPNPPKLIVKRRSEAKKKSTRSRVVSSGVLGDIDKKLMKKGIELPAESQPISDGNLQASNPAVQPVSRPTVELSPRLSKETNPYLMDSGAFQSGGKPVTTEKSNDPQSVAAPQSGNPQEMAPVFKLPASVTQAQTTTLPEKKDDSANGKRDEQVTPDDTLDQIKSEFGKFKSILGPMFGK